MADPTAYGPTPSVGTGDFEAIQNRGYHTIDWTNGTGADVNAGDIVVVGGIPMCSVGFIANGSSGSLVYLTVVKAKKDASTFAQLDKVYWNATGNPVVGTAGAGAASNIASGGVEMGFAIAAAATGDSYVMVSLIPRKDGVSIGASTAAAGTTTADAGGLPAGTARVYPTTAADGTKGVRIDPADKVSGRMLMIGNGVSAQILKVYPPTGGTINGAATDAAFSSVSGKGVIAVCLSAASNTWLMF